MVAAVRRQSRFWSINQQVLTVHCWGSVVTTVTPFKALIRGISTSWEKMIEGHFCRSPCWRPVEETRVDKAKSRWVQLDGGKWHVTHFCLITEDYLISAFIQHMREALQKKIIKLTGLQNDASCMRSQTCMIPLVERERTTVLLKHLKQLFNQTSKVMCVIHYFTIISPISYMIRWSTPQKSVTKWLWCYNAAKITYLLTFI